MNRKIRHSTFASTSACITHNHLTKNAAHFHAFLPFCRRCFGWKKKTQDFQRGRKVVGNPGIVNPQNKYIRNTQWQTSAHVIYKHKYVLNINRNLFFSACRFYLLASTFRTLKHKSNQRINKQLNERALMVGVVLKAKRYGWYRHLYYCNLCWSPFWRCYPTWWLDECSFEKPNVHNGTEYVTQLCFHLTGNLWFALTWKTWHSIHL